MGLKKTLAKWLGIMYSREGTLSNAEAIGDLRSSINLMRVQLQEPQYLGKHISQLSERLDAIEKRHKMEDCPHERIDSFLCDAVFCDDCGKKLVSGEEACNKYRAKYHKEKAEFYEKETK